MISDILSVLVNPAETLSLEMKKSLLTPYISAGFWRGLSLNSLLKEIVGTPLGMRRSTFLEFAGGEYARLEAASQYLDTDDETMIRVGDLPEWESIIPDRFWARLQFTYRLPNGTSVTDYKTFGFDKVMSVGDIKGNAMAQFLGIYIPEELEPPEVELLEIYKQY